VLGEEVFRAIADLGADALQDEKIREVGYSNKYLTEPIEALRYFLYRMFFRGRPDRLSEAYANDALQKVRGVIARGGWEALKTQLSDWKEGSDPIGLGSRTLEDYDFPDSDTKMVYDALRELLSLPDKNMVRYAKDCIKTGHIRKVYEKITRIRYVKDKLACMYLRDVAYLYGLLGEIREDEVRYFLPIDTWVRQFCKNLKMVENVKADNELFKERIIEKCSEFSPRISPVCFDHGLWILSQLRYTVKNLDLVKRNTGSLEIIRNSGVIG